MRVNTRMFWTIGRFSALTGAQVTYKDADIPTKHPGKYGGGSGNKRGVIGCIVLQPINLMCHSRQVSTPCCFSYGVISLTRPLEKDISLACNMCTRYCITHAPAVMMYPSADSSVRWTCTKAAGRKHTPSLSKTLGSINVS